MAPAAFPHATEQRFSVFNAGVGLSVHAVWLGSPIVRICIAMRAAFATIRVLTPTLEGRIREGKVNTRSRSPLETALEQFNRKERFWLLSDAVGIGFKLHEEFRSTLEKTISVRIPRDPWWAFDYHLDWLCAVLLTPNYGAADNGQDQNAGQ